MMRGQTEHTQHTKSYDQPCRKARRTMAAPHPNPPGETWANDDLAFMKAILQKHNILDRVDWGTGKTFLYNDREGFTSHLSDTLENNQLLNIAMREYNRHLLEWNKQKLHEGYSVAEIRSFEGVKMLVTALDIRTLFNFISDTKGNWFWIHDEHGNFSGYDQLVQPLIDEDERAKAEGREGLITTI
ncbi:hypothetical protein HYFRA_00001999 [Hymenoscyphus fraxineus]|uniref:Uncharacterized protein n=1 Tax=Hymenoscyphus fraxineus TaxID=746836 RepID=A0A9N9PMF2_9HELO|nr:hypothetical protein HYFRA_00001999 [Hymenoscyphus fraxineus]